MVAGALRRKAASYSFELHPRDEAGAQALGVLRNRAISIAANALGQAADHVRDFFSMVRVELGFYVGCINLHQQLSSRMEPTCIPSVWPADASRYTFQGLYDVALALSMRKPVVGNDLRADSRELIVITGPNSGGKSTFLRSLGLAQLMFQTGMFVPAEAFSGSVCEGIFTHFKREEDVTMESGKFDEELSRMSQIVDHITPRAMVLLNESFAATNEREGSEVARQVILALLDEKIRVVCVTHMYELAHGFFAAARGDWMFLRAARTSEGTRTFRVIEAEPLPTSYGEDLYRRVFSEPAGYALPEALLGCASSADQVN